MQSDEDIEADFNRGHALLLEDRNCVGQYLYADELKRMVSASCEKLDFVFMAACHSEFAARIFLEAGAHHVIGVN